MSDIRPIQPPIVWMGGKRKIMKTLIQHVPKTYNTYYEPFLGGGALLLNLQPKKAICSDTNSHIIDLFNIIKNHHTSLLKSMKAFETKVKQDDTFYYTTRDTFNRLPRGLKKTVLFIYLLYSCFGGIYIEDKQGKFISTSTGYKRNYHQFIYNRCKDISNYLKSSTVYFFNQDYKKTLQSCKKGDFIFIDPPYYRSGSKYSKDIFGKKEHIELFTEFKRLTTVGCKIILTNSNDPFILKLYKQYTILPVKTVNGIHNSKKISELIIKNF